MYWAFLVKCPENVIFQCCLFFGDGYLGEQEPPRIPPSSGGIQYCMQALPGREEVKKNLAGASVFCSKSISESVTIRIYFITNFLRASKWPLVSFFTQLLRSAAELCTGSHASTHNRIVEH